MVTYLYEPVTVGVNETNSTIDMDINCLLNVTGNVTDEDPEVIVD